jgi:hypothetical protein
MILAYLKIIERGEWAVSGLAQPLSTGGAYRSMGMGGTLSGGGSDTIGTTYSVHDGSSSGGTVTGAALGKIGAFNPTSARGPGVGDGGDKVLVKCVRLLKTYLLVYYPSDYVLVALDRFCHKMQGIFEDASKSFEYVRALVEAISMSRHGPYLGSTSMATSASGSSAHASAFNSGGAAPLSSSTLTTAANNNTTAMAQINGIHFNTAPSSVLANGLLSTASGAPSSTPAFVLQTGHISSSANAVHSGPSSPTQPRGGGGGGGGGGIHGVSSSESLSQQQAVRISPAPPLILTPNFIASRAHIPPSKDPLDTLLCSSIFAGRTPKALLDLFAEHTDTFIKSGPNGLNGASNTSHPFSALGSTQTVTVSTTGGSTRGSGKLESSSSNSLAKEISSLSSKSQSNHATRSFLFSLHDQDLRERIATVSISKKLEERAMYRSFRRGQPLFQYKHYNEQVKLDLSASQIDAIVAAIIQSENHESRLLASKIMIKLIMDMYCHDPIEVASASLLSILLELIHHDQPIDTKIHAFNLIFNLSTHLNMFEDVSFFGPTNTQNPNSSSNPSLPGYAYSDYLQGSTPTIHRIQNELFSIVKELHFVLVQQQETNRKLWFSGLSCLLYFMTDTGHIEKDKYVPHMPSILFFLFFLFLFHRLWLNNFG